VGRTLGRLFLDNAELSASRTLKADIEDALAQSRFLIVLCSPEAAASTWVPLEIKSFKARGRGNFILPILISGEPTVYDPETAPNGAFPKELFGPNDDLDTLPLAPDFREAGGSGEDAETQYQTAFLRIVARLLDLPFPELTQRQLVAERQRRRFRNRVIALLVGLLGLAVAGGATAWVQKSAADVRLSQALKSAARQVDIAAASRDRYGVPTSFATEMYAGASEDFTEILDYSGGNPTLLLNRARYHLGMADLRSDTGGSALAGADHVRDARRDIETATGLRDRWYTGALYGELPEQSELTRVRIDALDRAARLAVQAQDGDAAQALAQQANALTALVSSEDLTEERVFGQCALADISYRLTNRTDAEAGYAACLSAAKSLVDVAPTPRAKAIHIRALIDYGMIHRLNRGSIEEAARLHDKAVELTATAAKDETVSNDRLLLAFEALATRSDTKNLMGADLTEVMADYTAAQAVLDRLIATDANRMDWRTQSANLSYRLAGGHARLAVETGDLSGLDLALADLDAAAAAIERPALVMPEDVDIKRTVSAISETRAEIILMRAETEGDARAAFELMTGVITARQAYLNTGRSDKRAARDLANAHFTRGRLFLGNSTHGQAVEQDFDIAREIFLDLSEDPEFVPNIYRDLALTDYFAAQFNANREKSSEACRLARSAETFAARHMEAVPDNATIANEWGVTRQGVEAFCPQNEP